MRALANRKALALLAAVAAAGFAVVGAKQTIAAPQATVINLCAKAGTATVSGAVSVPIWGFGIPSNPTDCATATASLPGPVLDIVAGDTVTLNITNALPAVAAGANADLNHALRFEVPGLNLDPGLTDVAMGGTLTRTFTASAPGTYLYQSAGDFGRQEAMGLYGAIIVRSNTALQAYNSATTAYDVDSGPLVLSQVDPAFNAAPDTFTFFPVDSVGGQSAEPGCDLSQTHTRCQHYRATYWLINGKAYPNTTGIVATAGQRVLLRYLNGGYDNTSMSILGMHERVLARDANLLNNPFDADTETIPAGGTEDAIATIPAGLAPSTNGFALFNRNVHVTNGDPVTNAPCGPGSSNPNVACIPNPDYTGGMLTFIHP